MCCRRHSWWVPGKLASAILLVVSATPTHTQERAGSLEEVIVMATRVQTNLQQTPMSIRAVSHDDLEVASIDTGLDLGIMVPNVVLNPGPHGEHQPRMTVRGLPGVTTYIDGIWLGDWGFILQQFVELARVEVLFGPQGTLFGRNTNGGAIQLVTRRPADEFGARIDVRIGEFDRRASIVSVDWPISERLKSKWTAAGHRNEGFLESQAAPLAFGDHDDRLLRADLAWEPTADLRLRFSANDESSRGSSPRIVRISNPQNAAYVAYNVLAGNPDYIARARALDPSFPDPPARLAADRYTAETHQAGYPGGELGEWETRSDIPGPTVTFDRREATLTLNWNVTPRFAFESLTSRWEAGARQISDYDASEFTFRTLAVMNRIETSILELHLMGSHLDGRLRSLFGFYYQHSENRERMYRWAQWEFAIPNTGPNPGVPGLPGVDGRPHLNTAAVDYVRSWGAIVGNTALATYSPPTYATADLLEEQEDVDRALFGQVSMGLLDSLELTLGFRVTADDGRLLELAPAEAFRPLDPGTIAAGDLYAAAAVLNVEEEPEFGTALTPRVAIAYAPTSEIFLYASYAEGFASSEAIANPLGGDSIILDPEIVATRELGLRSDWLGDRLRLNATYFDSRWNGLRVRRGIVDPASGQVIGRVPTSEGVAKSTGLELDLHYLFGERWSLDFALGLLDTEYLDVGDAPPDGTGLQPGIPFQYAPETSYFFAAKYRLPLVNGAEVLFSAAYGWMDDYQRANASDFQTKNPDGSSRPEPAYGILNARIDYRARSANWTLTVFGTNLTNEWYVNGGLDVGRYEAYDYGTIGRPRELGVGVRLHVH